MSTKRRTSITPSVLQAKSRAIAEKYAVEGSWKDIIFLPFVSIIAWLMMACTYLSVIYSIYKLAYHPEYIPQGLEMISWIIEVMYFLYVGILIMHRVMKRHRQRRIHRPSPIPLLVADVISVLPIATLYTTLNKYTWKRQFWEFEVAFHSCYLKFVRIIRIVYTYIELRSNLTLNQEIVIFVCHNLVSLLFIFILAAIYHYIGIYPPPYTTQTWMTAWIPDESSFNTTDNNNWFIICTNHINGFFFNNSMGNEVGVTIFWQYSLRRFFLVSLWYTNTNDYVVIFLSMLIGFICQYTYVIGTFTGEQCQSMRPKYVLQRRVEAAKQLMPTIGMSKQQQEVFLDYYRVLWQTRKGILSMPGIFNNLPPMMQNEVKTDIYWEALQHTKIFNNVNPIFRRKIVEVMRTELYLPERYIYHENNIKSKLIYVHSGVLEITCKLDTILLTAGSVLSEMTCIRPLICTAKVRCLTPCTLHMLDYVDFYQVLLQHHGSEFKIMREDYDQRLKYSRRKLAVVGKLCPVSHLSWLRKQWHELYNNNVSKYHDLYSAKFLDMIALARTHVQENPICLRGHCPFVMAHGSKLRYFVSHLALGAIILNFWWTFEPIFFDRKLDIYMYTYYLFLDSICILDLIVECITTIPTDRGTISNSRDILAYKIKDVCFVLTLLGTLPLDYIPLIVGSSPEVIAFLRVNRFLRLYEVIRFFRRQQKQITAFMEVQISVKFLSYHILMILCFVCVLVMAICASTSCHRHSFVEYLKATVKEHINKSLELSDFRTCLYYVTNVYMKLLLFSYKEIYIPEILVKILIVLFSYNIRTYEMSQYCGLIALRFEEYNQLQENIEKLDVYLHKHRSIRKYRPQMMDILETAWQVSGPVHFKDLCSITYQHSDFLQQHLTTSHIRDMLTKTKFFTHFPEALLQNLSKHAKVFLIPKDHELVMYGHHCSYLYMLIQGYCVQQSNMPGDTENQHKGYFQPLDVFPILAFLHRTHSQLTVKTYTAVQLLCIPYTAYRDCISVFHDLRAILDDVLTDHMEKYGGIMKFKKILTRNAFTSDKPEMFTYTIRKQVLILDITNTKRQVRRDTTFQRYRSCLYYILNHTTNPNTYYYLVYEIFRCLCIMVHVNLTLLLVTRKVYQSPIVHLLLIIAYILWIIDMFVQMHLQYYNELGIVVTAVRSTVLHYLRRSFAIHFIGGLPIDFLKLKAFARPVNRNSVELLMLASARMFMLARPYCLSQYLQGHYTKRGQSALRYITFILIFYFIIMYLAVIKLLIPCNIDEERHIVCPKDAWVIYGHEDNAAYKGYLYRLTVTTVLFTGVCVGRPVYKKSDFIMITGIALFLSILRMRLIARIMGSKCTTQTRALHHHTMMAHYKSYFRNRMVSNHTKDSLVHHYENLWKLSYGNEENKVFSGVYPRLREILLYRIYDNALNRCLIFQNANMKLFTLFIPHVNELSFIKEAEIIQTNDVQGNIFIIVNGEVGIYVAGARLALLGPGGIFGCFEPSGITRHTMAATAKENTTVLSIKAKLFYLLIRGYTHPEELMRRLRSTQFQYASEDISKIIYEKKQITRNKQEDIHLNLYRKMLRMYLYFSYVIVAPLSVYIVMIDWALEMGVLLLPCWILFDIYFFLFAYARLRVTSSLYNRNFSKRVIIKNYIKSTHFYIDIVTLVPIYLFRAVSYQDWHQFWFMFNKLFRLYYFIIRYRHYSKKKDVPNHMKWILMIYTTIFLAHIIFILWWFIVDLPYQMKTTIDIYIEGYLLMMNMVSSTGLYLISTFDTPIIAQLYIDMLLATMSTLLSILLTLVFMRRIMLGNSHECNYRYRAREFRHFCRRAGVSKGLLNSTMTYLHSLYRKQRGVQFPELYAPAPRYIKQQHMTDLFAKYFVDHPLFYDLHIDLLRQIREYAKLNYYMSGSIIVDAGIKNTKIYFIDKGSVLATESQGGHKAPRYEIIGEGKSFGELTAFLNKEHTKTYKAITTVDLLSLDVAHWEYLLEWFPASKQKLDSHLREQAWRH